MAEDIERLQNAHDALKRIHVASNDANDKLLMTNEDLINENQYLKTQLENAEKNIEIQKMIVRNSIQSSQEMHERDYDEISILKGEILKLKNELLALNKK